MSRSSLLLTAALCGHETTPAKASGPAPTLVAGARVARYVVCDKLGQGAMGMVYRAFDPELDRHLALKLLPLTMDRGAGRLRDRLVREAKALARLTHPNVITVYDVGCVDGAVFMALELVEGRTLGAWLRERRRSVREVLRTFAQAGEGLAAAHRAGIVHRDFKPENVLVGRDGRVRVVDFGLARAVLTEGDVDSQSKLPVLDAEGTTSDRTPGPWENDPSLLAGPMALGSGPSATLSAPLTRAGSILGTPAYMAPEQYLGEPTDARTDQFAFCIALHEALYGEHPFAGDNLDELRLAITGGLLRPPLRSSPVPNRLRRVLQRGLSATPAARFPSMDALLGELRGEGSRGWPTAAAAVAFTVVLAATGLVRRAASTRAPSACADAAGEVTAVWGPSARARLETAFATTGRPHAASMLVSVTRSLDTYVAEWSAARRGACAAASDASTASDASAATQAATLRTVCLSEHLAALSAHVEVLATADGPALDHAALASPPLPSIRDCDDAEALRARYGPTRSAERASAESEPRSTLARAVALDASGRTGEALALVRSVARDAERAGDEPLVAEALYERGVLEAETGAADVAAQDLRRAARLSDASRDDRLAARALAALAGVLGEGLGRYDEAELVARDAEAKEHRIGGDDALATARLGHEARLFLRSGRLREARSRAEEALTVATRRGPAGTLARAEALDALATLALREARVSEALERRAEAFHLLGSVLGPQHPRAAVAHEALARVYLRTGRWADAEAALEALRTLHEARGGEGDARLASVLDALAEVRLARGDTDGALSLSQRARVLADRSLGPDHPEALARRVHLGRVLRLRGAFAEAAAVCRQVAQSRGPGTSAVVALEAWSELGALGLAQGQPQDARRAYETAVTLAASLHEDAEPAALLARGGLGVALAQSGAADAGVAILEAVLTRAEAKGLRADQRAELGWSLAKAFVCKGDRSRARAAALVARDELRAADGHAPAIPAMEAWLAGLR